MKGPYDLLFFYKITLSSHAAGVGGISMTLKYKFSVPVGIDDDVELYILLLLTTKYM